MSRWQPATRRKWYSLALACLVLTAGTTAFVATQPTQSSAAVNVDALSVSDTNETVSGDVNDVQLDATINYEHDVPDATRRIVKVKVGTSEDDLTLLDYQQTRDPEGAASGSVTLAGSVLDHEALSASDFDPAIADTSSQEIVVQAVIEVERATGDTVRKTVTDTATVTLTDSTELTVAVGGSGSVDVSMA